jgi:large subunit ribosomal protein L35
MPKLKTNRGASKRFKRTATGKFKHAQSHHNHILTKKSSKRKRNLRPLIKVSASDGPSLTRLLPYA